MFNIDLKIEDKDIQDGLKELQGKIENMRPVMVEVSETMLKKVHENFDAEGRPVKWAMISDKTRKQREKSKVRTRDKEGNQIKYKRGEKKGQYKTRNVKPTWPGKILQVSGLLMDSISTDADENSASVGTNKIYAATHQFGAPDRNIPGRPFLVLTDNDLNEIQDDIVKWMEK